MGRELVCCGEPACRKKQRALNLKERSRTYAQRTAPRGRQCGDCHAYDHEVSFQNEKLCEVCYTSVQRHGRCETCQTPMRSNEKNSEGLCVRCHPPRHQIEVLWEAPDGRLRRLFRTMRGGTVNIAGKQHRVLQNPMLVRVKEAKLWAKVRV